MDRIIDEIAEDERVDALYKEWNKWQGEIRKFYENSPEKQVPLSQCAAFKSLKNLVIKEALQINPNVRIAEWIQEEAAVREPSVFFCYSKADDWSAKNISGRVPKRKQDGKISY